MVSHSLTYNKVAIDSASCSVKVKTHRRTPLPTQSLRCQFVADHRKPLRCTVPKCWSHFSHAAVVFTTELFLYDTVLPPPPNRAGDINLSHHQVWTRCRARLFPLATPSTSPSTCPRSRWVRKQYVFVPSAHLSGVCMALSCVE